MEQAQQTGDPMWSTGDRLAKARRHAGLNGAELAERIGISRATVTNYEGEKVAMRRPVLIAWAFACGVRLDWLLGNGPDQGGPSSACGTEEYAAMLPIFQDDDLLDAVAA